MATLPVGSVQFIGYTGATITLANQSWKNNVSAIYKQNANRNGYQSFKPASGINSLTTLEAGNHYQISVVTSFDLPGADILHYEAGSGTPEGVVVMDGEILVMA